jgi:hypothetical protein
MQAKPGFNLAFLQVLVRQSRKQRFGLPRQPSFYDPGCRKEIETVE